MVQRIDAGAGLRGWRAPWFRASERRIGVSCAMPLRCHVWLRITDGHDKDGPQVTMLAALVLPAMHVRVIHRASPTAAGPPGDEIALTLPLVPALEQIARPSRTFRLPAGGAGMSLQLFDHARAPLTEEREFGARADGVREEVLPLVARVHPAAWLSLQSGREGPEPRLRLGGELVFSSGIGVRLRVRPFAGAAEPDLVDIPLASVGTTLHFPDRLVERDLPGLPAVLLVFIDADGQPIGHERLAHVRPE